MSSTRTRTQGLGFDYNVELMYGKADDSKDSAVVSNYEYTEFDVMEIIGGRRGKAEFWNTFIEEFENWPHKEGTTPIDLSFHDETWTMHFPFVRYNNLDDEQKHDFDDMLESFMETKDMSVYGSCFI